MTNSFVEWVELKISTLEKRVGELEREVQELRDEITVPPEIQKGEWED